MKFPSLRVQWLFGVLVFLSTAAIAETGAPSDAETQGIRLARQLCDGWPAAGTNTGILQIRGAERQYSEMPVTCEVRLSSTNYQSLYLAGTNNARVRLAVIHAPGQMNRYFYQTNSDVPLLGDIPVLGHLFRSPAPADLTAPFAGSDFELGDLGLEFFHWPEQKIIKKEFSRGRACQVLESVNPHPAATGYSRVDSWIDEESSGIVHAEAYDANDRLLKVFDPKSVAKVNGQWELQDMEIRNVQTGSRTRIEFDLKPD
jgi:hypothetical protein